MRTPLSCTTTMGVIEHTVFVLGGSIIYLIFSPLLIGFGVVGTIWKISVILLAKYYHPDLISISYNDAFFSLYSCDQQPLMSVGTTFRLRGRLEMGELIKKFKECFLTEKDEKRYINLYCYFVMYYGYVFKKRVPKLSLKNHFIEKILPRGIDPEDYLAKWIVTDTYLHKPERQPCWQVLVVRRGTEKDEEETLVSLKMHHGMIDGYSLLHMIDKLTGSKSPYIVNKKKESIFIRLRELLKGPVLAAVVFFRVLNTPDLFYQGNPFEPEWTMAFSTLEELETVKYIRKKTKAKFSTIMMSAMTGALRRMYMEDKNYSFEQLPQQIFIESPLALPDHPSMTKGGKLCNHFTAGIYASQLKSNDQRYNLYALEKDFQSFQDRGGIQLLSWVVFGYYWLVPAVMIRQYTNYLSYLWRFSVLYSGLLASPKNITMVGHPVENIYFLQATASAFPYVSLFCMSSSYAGKLDFTCYASKEFVTTKQELERFVQVHLKAELAQMKQTFSDNEQHETECIVLDMNESTIERTYL